MSTSEGVRKSAILMMALGEKGAADVLKQLTPNEVQDIGMAMVSMQNIEKEEISAVIAEFRSLIGNVSPLAALDQNQYLKSVMNMALGEDKANSLLDRIITDHDSDGIERLKWMEPISVSELIQNEHPQVIATILAHFEPRQASDIIRNFSERLRNDTVLRLATLDGVQPAALTELNEALSRILSSGESMRKAKLGGIKAAAELMNFMGKESEASIISSIESHDANLAQAIQDEMFTFDDLIGIDDRGFQTLLREVSSDMLITALRGAPDELKDKILRNMSKRAAESMKEDLENRGPVKVSEVEEAQKEIIAIVRQLSDDGQIMIAGQGGDDAYL
jgi:flagellar motor switch protein FliG